MSTAEGGGAAGPATRAEVCVVACAEVGATPAR